MRRLPDEDFHSQIPLKPGEGTLRIGERHLRQAEARLSAQRALVAALDREGRDTAPATDLVRTFEKTVAEYRAHLTLQRVQAASHGFDL
jgi:hypothetical protein